MSRLQSIVEELAVAELVKSFDRLIESLDGFRYER
jgi:hypothetical protein